jgi:transcriptional regulator with XRE-family HTH domain
MTTGELLRETRARHGLSQRALAVRAGTTQAWISAIERGRVQPTVEMLRRLLLVMGEELVLGTRRLPGHADHDPVAAAENRRRSAVEYGGL